LAAYTWTREGSGNQVEVDLQSAGLGPQFGSGWMVSFGGPFAPAAWREAEINPLPNHVWTFDTAFPGHLVQTTSTDGTADYQYDPRGQLIAADYTAGAGLLTVPPDTSAGAGLTTVPPDEFYTYDANGNRTNPGYITGDHNRLLSDGTYHYEYDAEGNRTRRTHIASGEVTEYAWDHRNRLVGVSTRATDNGPLTTDTQYAYDYLNRWIARSHDPDGDGPLDFSNTYFVYDGTPPSGSMLDLAAVTMENIGQIVLHFEADAQGDPQLAHCYHACKGRS
jgi:YD repeat-containing protein